jgi:hypothetical protein
MNASGSCVKFRGEDTRANDLEVGSGDKKLSCEGEMSTVITRPFPLSLVLGVMGLIPCEGSRDFARDRCEEMS